MYQFYQNARECFLVERFKPKYSNARQIDLQQEGKDKNNARYTDYYSNLHKINAVEYCIKII